MINEIAHLQKDVILIDKTGLNPDFCGKNWDKPWEVENPSELIMNWFFKIFLRL